MLGYSPANRLASATGPWGTESFTYDPVGNRLNDNVTSGTTTTRLAAYATTSNRITSLNQNAAAFRTYAYDTGGNISTDTRPGETYVFTYNKRNRLSSLTRNAVAYATYGYNALEQMVTRSTSATGGPVGQVAYIYDLDGHLIAEATASSGVTTRDYLWLAANDNAPLDMPLAVAEAALLYMVHTDHLGRPIRMTDSTKATVFQAVYKPYGEIYSTSGTKAQNLRFPGQYFQIETGFAYNWRRQYDPVTGRYTQPDPLGLRAGMNRFGYANASPFRYTDRTGLEVESTGGFNYDPPSPPSSSDDPTGICSSGEGNPAAGGPGGPTIPGPNGPNPTPAPTGPNAGPNWQGGPVINPPTPPSATATTATNTAHANAGGSSAGDNIVTGSNGHAPDVGQKAHAGPSDRGTKVAGEVIRPYKNYDVDRNGGFTRCFYALFGNMNALDDTIVIRLSGYVGCPPFVLR